MKKIVALLLAISMDAICAVSLPAQSGTKSETQKVHRTAATHIIYTPNPRINSYNKYFWLESPSNTGYALYDSNGQKRRTTNASNPPAYYGDYCVEEEIREDHYYDIKIVDPDGMTVRTISKVDGKLISSVVGFNDGVIIVRLQGFDEKYISYEGEEMFVCLKANDKNNGFISVNGLSPASKYVRLQEGIYRFYDVNTGLYGYADQQGKVIIQPQFHDAHCFSEGLAVVHVKNDNVNLWGVIDKSGRFVIEPMFSKEPKDFHDGYCIVRRQDGKFNYIDRYGQICGPEFALDHATRFFNGYAFIYDAGETYVMDTSFDRIRKMPSGYYNLDDIKYFDDFLVIGSKRIFTPDGRLIVDADGQGTFVESHGGPYTVFWSHDTSNVPSGYVDKNGAVVMGFLKPVF